jgi:hypothetical protein
VVEHLLAKEGVASSNLVFRSVSPDPSTRQGDVAKWLRRRSAKPLSPVRIRSSPPGRCAGSALSSSHPQHTYEPLCWRGIRATARGAAGPGGGRADAAGLNPAAHKAWGFESPPGYLDRASRIASIARNAYECGQPPAGQSSCSPVSACATRPVPSGSQLSSVSVVPAMVVCAAVAPPTASIRTTV